MGDFIKELNIIDFLGMLLPGSIFLILSDQGEEVLRLCQVFFGKTDNRAAVGTFLIIAGYLVGMLVHEVGDLTERGLWHISWLDPKYYAARAVGLEKLLEKYNESSKEWPAFEEKTNKLQTGLWIVAAFCSTIFYEWVLLTAFQINLCTWPWWGWIMAIAIPIVLLIVGSKKARELRHANQWIQTEMVDKQNCKKRVVFDGFHVMMRNLILVIALLNYMQAAKLSMPQCVGRIIVAIMIVRYMHYSYLKYKYSYEDYLKELAQKEKKAEEKGPAV